MDVSELRKGILRALEDARRDAAARREAIDNATVVYGEFLSAVAEPLFRQAVTVLRAEHQQFSLHTPAGKVRLVSDAAPETFAECELDTSAGVPQVLGRISRTRGRRGQVIEEQPLGDGRPVADLSEHDVSRFLLAAIPRLVLKS